MPVSTRSSQFDSHQDDKIGHLEQSEQQVVLPVLGSSRRATLARDPHHGLKEKMRALTVLYEQHQKQRLASRRDSISAEQQLESWPVATHHDSVELLESGRKTKEVREDQENLVIEMKENIVVLNPPRTVKNHEVFRRIETKENREAKGNRKTIAVFPCPPKQEPFARKLSLGGLGGPMSDGKFARFRVQNEPAADSENVDSGGSRILVFVRLRPLAKKEKEAGARSCVKIVNRKDVYLTEFASENDYLRLKRLRGRHFCFDASFPDTTSQHEVYATSAADLVEGVLQGRNGSVFCYGATGAGKTYTMLGSVENPGVMVLAIKDLFSKIRQRSYDGNHSVQLSYLEVYNETVRDLLSPGRPLVLREDKQGIVAAGLTQYRAYTTDEVMALLQQGNKNRTTEPTRANETSSRSHAILQVVAEYKVVNAGQVVQRIGKLSLIDLAGSERALATDQRTLRSVEGANINRSLLALSSCINALVEGKKHIPYRNSKLTQLLKDSLGGPCNTVMIANISPSNLSFGETQNTLHWADRAKEIKTKACTLGEAMQIPQSETDQTKLVLELQKENSDLRQQIARQQQKFLTVQAQSLAATPTPPSVAPSPLCSPVCSTQRKTKRCIIAGNCFGTPESKSRANNDSENQELRRRVKNLESEIDILKKEHLLQLKQKDDFIRDLITKYGIKPPEGDNERRITRASARKADRPERPTGDLKSPSHRFISPIPPAKKRSFWDVSTSNTPSPSVATKGRKLRASIATETANPSMLLQPGFARQRTDTWKK